MRYGEIFDEIYDYPEPDKITHYIYKCPICLGRTESIYDDEFFCKYCGNEIEEWEDIEIDYVEYV